MEVIMKVEGGLLRIDLELENNVIKNIMISGDFFFFPEEKLEELEKELKGKNINESLNVIKEFYTKNNIEASITPDDIYSAIKKAVSE